MGVLVQRSAGYKGGLVALFFGGVALVVGFATPHWFTYSVGTADYRLQGHAGLWAQCFSGHCEDSDFTDGEGWLVGVKVLQGVAIAGAALADLYVLAVHCCSHNPSSLSRLLEVTAALSGLVGGGACLWFGIQSSSDVDSFNAALGDSSGIRFQDFALHWSFWLDAAGCLVLFLAGVIIAVTNKPLPPNPSTTRTVAANTIVFTNLGGIGNGNGKAPMAMPGSAAHVQQLPHGGSNPYAVHVIHQIGGGGGGGGGVAVSTVGGLYPALPGQGPELNQAPPAYYAQAPVPFTDNTVLLGKY